MNFIYGFIAGAIVGAGLTYGFRGWINRTKQTVGKAVVGASSAVASDIAKTVK